MGQFAKTFRGKGFPRFMPGINYHPIDTREPRPRRMKPKEPVEGGETTATTPAATEDKKRGRSRGTIAGRNRNGNSKRHPRYGL